MTKAIDSESEFTLSVWNAETGILSNENRFEPVLYFEMFCLLVTQQLVYPGNISIEMYFVFKNGPCPATFFLFSSFQ